MYFLHSFSETLIGNLHGSLGRTSSVCHSRGARSSLTAALPSEGSSLLALRPCFELLCTNMLSETASTCPSTFTVVDNTTCIFKVKNSGGVIFTWSSKCTRILLARFPHAWGEMRQSSGTGPCSGCFPSSCDYGGAAWEENALHRVLAHVCIQTKPDAEMGKAAIFLLLLEIQFSIEEPGQPLPADPRAVIAMRSWLCVIRKLRSKRQLGGHFSKLRNGFLHPGHVLQ